MCVLPRQGKEGRGGRGRGGTGGWQGEGRRGCSGASAVQTRCLPVQGSKLPGDASLSSGLLLTATGLTAELTGTRAAWGVPWWVALGFVPSLLSILLPLSHPPPPPPHSKVTNQNWSLCVCVCVCVSPFVSSLSRSSPPPPPPTRAPRFKSDKSKLVTPLFVEVTHWF